MYTDRAISCVDCGQEFNFTAGEQEFYAQRGFTESPKRCPSCRQIKKAQRNRGGDSYGSNGGGNGGGYGGYESSGYGNGGSGGYSGGGYGERRSREMFEAVCANCGKTASVPFRPSGARPVYCSDCFESRR